jgi:hypothetical protein
MFHTRPALVNAGCAAMVPVLVVVTVERVSRSLISNSFIVDISLVVK